MFESDAQNQFFRQLNDSVDAIKFSIGFNYPTQNEIKLDPPKLYPHKFFVQFHRGVFRVPSSEMGTFTKSNGETITYSKDLCFRILTFCTIHPIDTAKWFCGQAVCNPKDTDNIMRGCKEAFSHAVLECFANTLGTMDWSDFAKLFFDALLKKNLTEKNILDGFVLKVRLPWEAKKHGH